MKVHHIGYLVEDIGEGILEFESLGFAQSKEGAVRDEQRGIWICFMQSESSLVELISPLSGQSTVSGMLKKRGAGPYHICYLSANMEEDIDTLTGRGYMLIQPPSPAVALKSKKVAFLFKKNTGIIELLEQ